MSAVAEKQKLETAVVPEQLPARIENGSNLTPMEMLDRALSSGASPDTLEKLMALQERWEQSQARKAFDAAMALAKSEIPVIHKNKSVSFGTGRTSYNHEDMAEIARTIDPILARHGLSYRFRTATEPDKVSVTCILSHRDGHSQENSLSGPPDNSGSKNNIQAIGSSVTYLQRYTLKAALGLAASDDDDGKRSESPSGPINEAQLQELIDLADDVGADKARFCKHMKIASLAELPANRLPEAKKALEAKRKVGGAQ